MTQTFSNARKCLRCGWEWIRRPIYNRETVIAGTKGAWEASEPKRCPRCRTEKWNTEPEKVLQDAR